MNKTQAVKRLIDSYFQLGLVDKRLIYDKISLELKLPRPTVRRIMHDYIHELIERIQLFDPSILSPDKLSDETKKIITHKDIMIKKLQSQVSEVTYNSMQVKEINKQKVNSIENNLAKLNLNIPKLMKWSLEPTIKEKALNDCLDSLKQIQECISINQIETAIQVK